MFYRRLWSTAVLVLGIVSAQEPLARATTFDTPRFVNPGDLSFGLEPILTVTNGAGVGFNARFKYGVSDLSNVSLFAGTGTAPRKERVGANYTFDFFPDLENQPGIGIYVGAAYNRLTDMGQFELVGAPYIHKTFKVGKEEFEPFIAIPTGIGLYGDGSYGAVSTLSVGSIFKGPEHIRYVIELGWGITGAESTVSGGVTYYR